MNDLVEILSGLHPEVDFHTCVTLVDDRILDSFDIITIIADINDVFDVAVPVEEIIPQNFNSAASLYKLVERLLGGEE